MRAGEMHKFSRELNHLRQQTKALVVVLITPDDCLFSVDPEMQPQDLQDLLSAESPNIAANEAARRKQ